MKEKIITFFEEYVSKYSKENSKRNWKYIHSYRVANEMESFAKKLNLNEFDIELAYTIGLLHDIGRFEQIKKYDSYDDIKTIDHGDLGYSILKRSKKIKEIFDKESYEVILFSIKNHNKRDIPESNDEKLIFYAKLIRDVDKLEILRGISEKNIFREYCEDEITNEINKEFYNNQLINRKYTKNINDKSLEAISFVFDLNFKYTYEKLINENTFTIILNNYEGKQKEVLKKYIEYAIQYLKEGI